MRPDKNFRAEQRDDPHLRLTPEQLLGRTAAKEEMTEERRWKTPYPRKILEGDKGPRRMWCG